MKQFLFRIRNFTALATVIPIIALAVPEIPDKVDDDLFYPDGVVFTPVEILSKKEDLKQKSSFSLIGDGTVTIGNRLGGGYPRIFFPKNSKITVERTWEESSPDKVPWKGAFSSPVGGGFFKKLQGLTVESDLDRYERLERVSIHTWGQPNMVFSFSPKVQVAIGVTENHEGKRLYVAHKDTSKTHGWDIQKENTCVVEDKLCIFATDKLSSVLLLEKVYTTCPKVRFSSVSAVPSCIVTCNKDYTYSEKDNTCVSSNPSETGVIDSTASDVFSNKDEDFKESAPVPSGEKGVTAERVTTKLTEYKFKHRNGSDRRILVKEVIPSYELSKHKNRRVGKSETDVINEDTNTNTNKNGGEDSQTNYRLQSRERFRLQSFFDQFKNNATVASVNTEEKTETPEDSNTNEQEESSEEELFHASAQQILPQTGAGLFLGVAMVGFLLMLLGIKKSRS